MLKLEKKAYSIAARPRLTRLAVAVKEHLGESGRPVVTLYDLFQEMRRLYASGRKLMLRKPRPDLEDLQRLRRNLIGANVLAQDPDFKERVYRVVAQGDRPGEEICGLVDRFCYVSHLSAMARYGLTDRRPDVLQLTAPAPSVVSELIREWMKKDYGEAELAKLGEHEVVSPPHNRRFPGTVRGQRVSVFRSSHSGTSIPIRGTFARIATVGQVFADMLEEPEECGGMAHVLEVWREHASTYLEDIIPAVDDRSKKITKVRAGYILDELLGIHDDRVFNWTQFAQRGGSRVLDPSRPFAPTYSGKWMLSLNVP
jgi:predicted transcriptional regulator of viral defense system